LVDPYSSELAGPSVPYSQRSALLSPTPLSTTRNKSGRAVVAMPTVMPPALRPSIANVAGEP